MIGLLIYELLVSFAAVAVVFLILFWMERDL